MVLAFSINRAKDHKYFVCIFKRQNKISLDGTSGPAPTLVGHIHLCGRDYVVVHGNSQFSKCFLRTTFNLIWIDIYGGLDFESFKSMCIKTI
jgi:hypothetical protein